MRRMNQHQMRRLTGALSVLENKDRNLKMPKKWNSKRKLRHIKERRTIFFLQRAGKKSDWEIY